MTNSFHQTLGLSRETVVLTSHGTASQHLFCLRSRYPVCSCVWAGSADGSVEDRCCSSSDDCCSRERLSGRCHSPSRPSTRARSSGGSRTVRLLRLLRLFKLLRLARVKLIIARHEAEYHALVSSLKVIKMMTTLLVIGHWLCCHLIEDEARGFLSTAHTDGRGLGPAPVQKVSTLRPPPAPACSCVGAALTVAVLSSPSSTADTSLPAGPRQRQRQQRPCQLGGGANQPTGVGGAGCPAWAVEPHQRGDRPAADPGLQLSAR